MSGDCPQRIDHRYLPMGVGRGLVTPLLERRQRQVLITEAIRQVGRLAPVQPGPALFLQQLRQRRSGLVQAASLNQLGNVFERCHC